MKLLTILKTIKKYLNFAMWVVVPITFLFANEFEEFGSIGWFLLLIVMLMRPLSQVLPQITWLKQSLFIRRELGMLSAVFILAHTFGYFISKNLSVFTEITTNQFFWQIDSYLFWGLWGMVVATVLLITSNRFSMKWLGKWWKRIQRGSYLYLLFGAIHIALVEPDEAVGVMVPVMVILVVKLMAYLKITLPLHSSKTT